MVGIARYDFVTAYRELVDPGLETVGDIAIHHHILRDLAQIQPLLRVGFQSLNGKFVKFLKSGFDYIFDPLCCQRGISLHLRQEERDYDQQHSHCNQYAGQDGFVFHSWWYDSPLMMVKAR